MRKVLFVLVVMGFATAGYSQGATPAKQEENAVFAWSETAHDFGKVKQGSPVTTEFKFKNTGKVALIITHVQASCGCTTPDWTKTPVPPGQEGFVKATYNAANAGTFDKAVTVTANIDGGTVVLKIKGEVTPQVQ